MPIKLLEDSRVKLDDLFIFEMANNHQGDVNHGLRIIREVAQVSKSSGIRAGIKLQFRQLDTFVHPDFREDESNKHIKRFLSTRLTEAEFEMLVKEIKNQGLLAICTPFDEPSVDLIVKMGFDILKIGSCSAKDWPLLEKATSTGLPMIVSTGGLSEADVGNLVSFLDHRYAHYALMHCVAIYPTPMDKLQLDNIERMKSRYPHIPIGFSTHEEPQNMTAIQVAYAKGARLFERHVGVKTEKISLNSYSSTPEEIAKWIQSYKEASAACGTGSVREIEDREREDLLTLQRGVFAKRDIQAGEVLKDEDVFFAFPIQQGQLPSGRWKSGIKALENIPRNKAIPDKFRDSSSSEKEIVYQAIHEIKAMLNEARVAVGMEFEMELSHHYGLSRFREVGTTIIECINREYCKKILVQLPGQQHPYHHHIRKEETFQVLAGELWIELEGRRRLLMPGDILLVQRGVKHRFWSETGAVIEEVSSTHYNNDSVYEDPKIANLSREMRKTRLVNWGRHQFA